MKTNFFLGRLRKSLDWLPQEERKRLRSSGPGVNGQVRRAIPAWNVRRCVASYRLDGLGRERDGQKVVGFRAVLPLVYE